MKLLRIEALLIMALSVLFLTSCQKAEDEAVITEPEMAAEDVAVPTRTDETELSITAEVTAINQETREITLMGEDGNSVTFVASDEVKRLDEIEVGDQVYIDYIVAVTMELREPTAEEAETPLTAIEDGMRATTTQPAGVKGRTIKAVSVIVGIDLPTETVTLQGPIGRIMTVKAENPENLTKVKIGDTVIVTYTETLAVSVAKLDDMDDDMDTEE